MQIKRQDITFTTISEQDIATLEHGNAMQQAAYRTIQGGKSEELLAAMREAFQLPRIDSTVAWYVEASLYIDRFAGPFNLRGITKALSEPPDPTDMFGEVPPGLGDKPLPWLRIGSSQYFGDFYVALASGQVNCFPPEVVPELWAGVTDYFRQSYDRFHRELFFGMGWSNDLSSLLRVQGACAERGIDTEAFEPHIEALADICGEIFLSGANVERYLSNRWFNFSRAELRRIKTLARPAIQRQKAKR